MSFISRVSALFSRSPISSSINASIKGRPSPSVLPSITALTDLASEYERLTLKEPSTRLPTQLPLPEFRGLPANSDVLVWKPIKIDNMSTRLTKLAWTDISESRNIKTLLLSASAICSLAAIEATLLLSSSATASLHSMSLQSIDSLSLVLSYSTLSILPSCTWHSVSPTLACTCMNLDPAQTLHTFTTVGSTSPIDASSKLLIQHLSTVRYLIATSALFRQLFRLSSVSLRVRDSFKSNIKEGDERPFVGLKEKVIRLGGSKSDVTVVSLDRYRDHIFPVYEYPHKVKYLVRKHSSNFTRPVYWRVESRNYGQRRGWENLVIGPDWLIQSTIPGREILVCEADLVNDEDSLSLAPNTARDLTMGQATDAFRSIGARAKECMPKQTFRVLRVVLGDSMELFTSGGGHSSTLRERVLKGKEADVLVDSRAPVWLAVLECLEKLVQVKSKSPTDEEPPDEKRRVLLFTDSAEYFSNLQQFMRIFNLEIVDGYSALQASNGKKDVPKDAAAFVLFSTTASTITHTVSLYQMGLMNHVEGVCALVDKVQGADQMASEGLSKLEVVCSSVIHDDLFRSVRMWSRMGFSSSLIQEELDFRFARILQAETDVTIENEMDEEKTRKRQEKDDEAWKAKESERAELSAAERNGKERE